MNDSAEPVPARAIVAISPTSGSPAALRCGRPLNVLLAACKQAALLVIDAPPRAIS
ncbi:hypothetical protein IV498_03085 [Paenarthrobacter sp. Z7-10]|uniref:hypothetical protein n=1 Tax=Paenarthrobacter sp. Z7-10 TaxID=2787635 RepID=UPI0022A9B8C5|nr:hypothetical protein [Paenarthrobacter sp. Z7-10]MCZ2402189.1 hypothetical protein [Paenarthrobacter sp. Z7-10]